VSVCISWEEIPNKAEQREYLERKSREFLSQTGLSTEADKAPVQEKQNTPMCKKDSKRSLRLQSLCPSRKGG
jgi:hypothetical protein